MVVVVVKWLCVEPQPFDIMQLVDAWPAAVQLVVGADGDGADEQLAEEGAVVPVLPSGDSRQGTHSRPSMMLSSSIGFGAACEAPMKSAP